MKRLIKDQNIKFDTHQAGDGQKVNLQGLHLEKILHKPKNVKIKFHFFNSIPLKKQNNNVDSKLLEKIQKEVSNALKKDENKKNELGQLIVNTLQRYKNDGIVEEEALTSARNIAKYFDLDEEFVRKTTKYAKHSNKVTEVSTTHTSSEPPYRRHTIKQNNESISISSRKRK